MISLITIISILLTWSCCSKGFSFITKLPSKLTSNNIKILNNKNIINKSYVMPSFKFRSLLSMNTIIDENSYKVPLKVASFNVLAPCYKRVPLSEDTISSSGRSYCMEAELEDVFMKRHRDICSLLKTTDADIICLQEFWSGSEPLRELYLSKLCTPDSSNDSDSCGCYSLHVLPRTSHWRSRADSVAVLVKKDKFIIEDVREILFHDCGDRVALMLRLAMKSSAIANSLGLDMNAYDIPAQRFLCVNTHLLFPHNQYSTKIRLREMTKILGYVEAYKQQELCNTVCGRSDVRLPIVISGDFNGSPRGAVYKFTRSQNYKSATEEMWSSNNTSTTDFDYNKAISYDNDNNIKNMHNYTAEYFDGMETRKPVKNNNNNTWDKWISHRSHRGQNVPVDHIFFQNPSDQKEEMLPTLPDWTNLVFQELLQRLATSPFPITPTSSNIDNEIAEAASSATAVASKSTQQLGYTIRQVFSEFDQDHSNYITREEFASALQRLGFVGEGTPCLTDEEIDVLVASADRNNDGMIDYKEFYDRFWLATAASSLVPTINDDSSTDDNNNDNSDNVEQLLNDYEDIDASNSDTNMKPFKAPSSGTLLNNRRLSFARSEWLSKQIVSDGGNKASVNADKGKFDNSNIQGIVENDSKGVILEGKTVRSYCSSIETTDSIDMGDLVVHDVSLYPKVLEDGVWPNDFTLSDHGILQCLFLATINGINNKSIN